MTDNTPLTVVLHPGDAAVLVTPAGEELHMTTRTLALFMDAARMGNDMLEDDAKDQPADDQDAAREDVAEVEDVMDWIEAHTAIVSISPDGQPMCTGMQTDPALDRIDTPAVHQQLRDVLDSMTFKHPTIPGTTDHGNGLVSIDTDED